MLSAVENEETAFLCENGNRIHPTNHIHHSAARVNVTREDIRPFAFGKPYGGLRHLLCITLRDNGSNEKLTAEHILGNVFVRFLLLGIIVIHRLHQCDALFRGINRSGINERNHLMAQTQEFFRNEARTVHIIGRLLRHIARGGAVQTVDRTEYAELNGTNVKLVVLCTFEVSADIVAPPCKADIGCICREVRQVCKRFPCNQRITREAERIAMRTKTGITGKNEGHMLLAVVKRVIVVENPHDIDACRFGAGALLPVDPPEVYAVMLVRLVKDLEICVNEFVGGEIDLYGRFRLGIDTHCGRHFLIHILKITNTRCGMEVQRYLESLVLQTLQEALIIGEKIGVPAITRPTALTAVEFVVLSAFGDLLNGIQRS